MTEGEPNRPVADLSRLTPELHAIPEAKFIKVIEILDEARHRPEIQAALAQIRPRIARIRPRPPRPLTLQRVLYFPLEDLLIPSTRSQGDGLIPRHAASQAWAFVAPRLPQDWRGEQERRLAHTHARDYASHNAIGEELWPRAAQILAESIAAVPVDRTLRRALLGDEPEILADLSQIVRVLSVGAQIQRLKAALPRPLLALSTQHIEAIVEVLVKHHLGQPDRAYAILLAIMMRLAAPGTMLERAPRLLAHFSTPHRNEIVSRLALLVVGDMEQRVGALTDGAADVAGRAVGAGMLINSLVAAERSLRAGDLLVRKELKSVRGHAEAAVGQIVADARASLETTIAGGVPADPAQRAESERSLLALRRCRRLADKVALDRGVTQALDAVVGRVKEHADRVIAALDRPAADEIPTRQASDELVWAIRMLELAGEQEQAERVWARGKALIEAEADPER